MFTVEDEFIGAYIQTALFTECPDTPDNRGADNPEPLDAWASSAEIDPDSLERMKEEARAWYAANRQYIPADKVTAAGEDYWLTRNHHGAGFWDSPEIWGEHTKTLTDNAHAAGERTLYVGDDWVIYQTEG